MSKRAIRRHHRLRMIAKARHITRRWHDTFEPQQERYVRGKGITFSPRGIDHTSANKAAVKYHNHLKVCSLLGHGCGNPRRGGWYSPLTLPELRAEAELQEELAELRGWVGV